MDLQLQGKQALIIGSTAGIGLAIARELAAEGAHIVINGRSVERLSPAQTQLQAAYPQVHIQGIVADLGTAEGGIVRSLI
jgi:short-subunit dehydrogenase